VGFGFGQVQARRLLIRCFADNPRGQAVAQALGFVAEPVLPKTWPRLRQGLRRVLAREPEPAILYFFRHAPAV
jgi:RimJ/RimL family protein N-acetyltransferase